MQRIQSRWLLIAACLMLLAGCQREDAAKPKTVAQYLHDVDSANAVLEKYRSDPAKYATDADVQNASQAMAQLMAASEFGSGVRKCWPAKEKPTTATTDHACLERLGHKR